MKTLNKVLGVVTENMARVAQLAVVVCMVYVVADVTRRGAVGTGFPGVVEVVELMGAVILSMGIGYLTFVRGHVAVDVLVMRLPPRRQAIFDLVNGAISLYFAVLLTRAMIKYGILNETSRWVTGVLAIPRHPFIYTVAAALALTCVVLIRDMVKAVIMLKTGGEA